MKGFLFLEKYFLFLGKCFLFLAKHFSVFQEIVFISGKLFLDYYLLLLVSGSFELNLHVYQYIKHVSHNIMENLLEQTGQEEIRNFMEKKQDESMESTCGSSSNIKDELHEAKNI